MRDARGRWEEERTDNHDGIGNRYGNELDGAFYADGAGAGYRCRLCPRDCGALRRELEGEGICGSGTVMRVARAALHAWEEPCISGSRGSGTIFFSGCPLRCAYCQNHAISRAPVGRVTDVAALCDWMRALEAQGAHNINLVTAGHFLPVVAEALQRRPVRIPVVYNSSGYERVEALRRLEGLVDVYLPDYKYSSAWSGERYSAAPEYEAVAQDAILEMARQVGGCEFDSDGILVRGLMVRHLLLPGHVSDACAALDWLDAHLPPGAYISLMGQYTPLGGVAGMPEIDRRVTRREYQRVCDHLFTLRRQGFVQDIASANAMYVPPFEC